MPHQGKPSAWSAFDQQVKEEVIRLNKEIGWSDARAIAHKISGGKFSADGIDRFRVYIKRHWRTIAGLEEKEVATHPLQNVPIGEKQARFTPVATKEDGRPMDVKEFCDYYGLDYNQVKSAKLINHSGLSTYNISFSKEDEEPFAFLTPHFVEELVKKHTKVRYQKALTFDNPEFFDRLVITDAHIGMETISDTSMYGFPWDKQAIDARLEVVIDSLKKYKRGNDLYITDLGDFMDGYNGKTARADHRLPQNMTTQQAFDYALEFKLRLLDNAVQVYTRVFLDNVCNDNHGGTLAYLVNSALEKIAQHRYMKDEVVVRNHKKFLSHFIVGNRAFVISHGKDQSFMKSGMSPKAKPDDITKIDGYCKANGLYAYPFVTFDKGDSHQCILDLATSDDFFYLSYPSFAPQSEWVQTNYKKGRSGFVIQNFDIQTGVVTFTPIFF